MNKLKEFVTKNAMKIMLSVVLFGSLWSPSKDIANYMYNGDTQSMIQHVIAESLKVKLEESKVYYAMLTILDRVSNFRTAEEVDKEVQMWVSNRWGSQLAAMKLLGESEVAQKIIKENIQYEQVYKALMIHAK